MTARNNPQEAKLRGRPWRVLRDKFRKHCATSQCPCWICDQPINYDASYREPNSFEADHVKPVSTHPHLALTMANLRPSHQSCNRSRGSKPIDGVWARAEW